MSLESLGLSLNTVFIERTGLPLNPKNPNLDIRDRDRVVEINPRGMTDVLGTVKNPYYVEGQGWGYTLEDHFGL